MRRIFIPSAGNSQIIKIEDEQSRYLSLVLRCKKGDEIAVFNGKSSYKSIITEVTSKSVTAEIIEPLTSDTESPLNSILVQGLLKGDKMDLVVQKTTELGIKEIRPVITGRSQIRETRKTLRWKKIAEEASRQSGRTSVPVVHEAMPFRELFTSGPFSSPPSPAGFIFWEESGLPLKEAALKVSPSSPLSASAGSPFLIVIGPEGGFEKKEVNIAESLGLIVATLGKRTVRAETAAITATALVQYLFGDMAGAL